MCVWGGGGGGGGVRFEQHKAWELMSQKPEPDSQPKGGLVPKLGMGVWYRD